MARINGSVQTQIDELAENLEERLVTWRRRFHAEPEVGWCEYLTTHRIVEVLSGIGWRVAFGQKAVKMESRCGLPGTEELALAEKRARKAGVPPEFLSEIRSGATGVVAELDTGRAGPTVAIRFDIDALPIQESSAPDHTPYALNFSSVHPGVMHACGHDGHAAIGLGLASLLPLVTTHLTGKVRLLFQPAEEGCRGAQSMVDAGAVALVDYLIGLHIGVRATKTGTLFSAVNGLMATRKFDVLFTGRPAHASMNPENGCNALLAAAVATLNIHAVPRHSQGVSRVNVGTLISGQECNIIPSRAYMKVETRGSETSIEEHVYQHAVRSIEAGASCYQVAYDLIPMGWAPSARCDRELARIIGDAAELTSEITAAYEALDGYGGSDDFSILMDSVQKSGGKACFSCLGADLAAGHHQEDFDFDEKCLVIGVKLLAQCVNLLLKPSA